MPPVVLIGLLAFAFGFVGSMPLAGPVAVLLVSRSVDKKYGEAIRIALGAVTVEAPYAGLAFFGFTTFLARYAWMLPASHAVTAVVLVVLGIYFARWHSDGKPKQDDGKRKSKAEGFLLGFSIAALNPTLIATWSAVTAALYSHFPGKLAQWMAIPFGLCAGLGTITWHIILVLLLRHFGERFPHRALTWAVRVMGLVLIAVAVVSGVQFVRWAMHH